MTQLAERSRAEVEAVLARPDVATNTYYQYLLLVNLYAAWEVCTPAQQRHYKEVAIQLTPRLRDSPEPDVLFESFRGLPQDDLYDTLRFDPKLSDDYKIQAGEEIYPEGSLDTQNWLANYLWWARSGNAPLAFHVWAGLSILSTVAQRRLFFPGGKRIWMNMYVMLGGSRSCGKGQAFDSAMQILHLVNDQVAAQPWEDLVKMDRRLNILPGDSTMEALVTEMYERTSAEVPGDVLENDDGTTTVQMPRTEQLVDATGLIPLDEAGTFFGKDSWGVARKGVLLTTMKESNRYTKRTKRSGLEDLNNLALGMLACCAPAWMSNVINTDYLGGGLMDRTVWVHREPAWARRRRWNIRNTPPKDPLVAARLANWLVERILTQPVKMPVLTTPQADKVLDNYYDQLLDREMEAHKKFGINTYTVTANRGYWTTLQVSALLALAEGEFPPLTVTDKHALTAIQWFTAEESSMDRFMKEAHQRQDQAVDASMLDFISECGGCCRRSEFNQKFRDIGLSGDLIPYVKSLEDRDMLEIVTITTPRRQVIYREPGHSCKKCSVA